MYSEEYISKGREETSSKISQEEQKMKRKRFTALKVTLTAMMLTAALTSGAGSAYAADLSQEGGSEPTVTITPSPEVTPELPLPTSTPKPTPVPKNGLLKEGKVYRYYVNNKPVRNKWKKINGKYYWLDRKSTRLNSSHLKLSRMPSSA